MCHSVCNNKIRNFKLQIICCYLVKHFIIKSYIGRFTFNYHNRFTRSVMNKQIRSSFKLVENKRYFNPYETRRIIAFMNKIIDKILPHPFFRR